MRHRRRGRKFGRDPEHQRALLRNLASALILTERAVEDDEPNKPKVRGRIITTLPKAKEVRPLVEKCVTIACRALPKQQEAERLKPDAARDSEQWRAWRNGPQWQEWNQAIAPVVTARRRLAILLGNKQAVRVLFDEIAPRFLERRGGYTRVLHLAKPRLGDSGAQAILEFVGVRDRQRKKSPRPAFESDQATQPAPAEAPAAKAAPAETAGAPQ